MQLAARVYSDPSRNGQVDLEARPAAEALARLHRLLDGRLRYAYLHLGSTAPTTQLDRHRVELALIARPLCWLRLEASYSVAAQHLPSGITLVGMAPRDDVLHLFAVSASARPTWWVELFARYELLRATSTDPEGAYLRDQVLAGATFRYERARSWRTPRSEAPLVTAGQVTFRHRADGARAVSVVGDWNGWDPNVAPLRASGAGWQTTVAVPPGRHEYAFYVDGRVMTPRAAPAYIDDGFGGRNGVLIVP
jgi:hypothetical protein